MPAAEHDVDAGLVRRLLAEQHPDLAGRRIAFFAEGFDNTLWRLGEDLVVRLPRRELAEVGLLVEQRWLGELAPRLPLPIPAPVRDGRPGCGFPWAWSVVPFLDGAPLLAGVLDSPRAAVTLGGFLRALHVPAPEGLSASPYRGTPVAARDPTAAERLAEHDDPGEARRARALWDDALAARPHHGPGIWVHGDLHPANVLVADADLVGILDFNDLNAGDPATDLASVWLLLEPRDVQCALEAYGGADRDLVARARGWAVLFSLFFVGLDRGGVPGYGAPGRAMLARALDGSLS